MHKGFKTCMPNYPIKYFGRTSSPLENSRSTNLSCPTCRFSTAPCPKSFLQVVLLYD